MVADVFGPGGLLERASRGYQVRAGQVRMAEAGDQAVRRKRHLAVEAPCGIGKTFAYLVPAILHAQESDARVVSNWLQSSGSPFCSGTSVF